jgi:phosphatidylinositol phospholipase C gamma-1
MGSAQFESLVELVNYYKRHPLYHKVKLCYPVNEDFVRGMGAVSYVRLLRPFLAA